METAETMQADVAARSPRGCNRPVMTQVTDTERSKLEGIAQLEMRSLSATIRMLILLGIQHYEADTEAASQS
ncbi:hypothetical protein [Halomonas urumqiensis]|uniref:Uncharacterized protein n=1 Tax=Halomonas urumqiensis TaxID=1684789 RepID=A0A2N7UDP2_9GAMM|nr:hypothetical protein [Halomonas urumqiensis]PMR78505.1 hypothetical protein C1H70_17335 [Halomonas urumqiensis]PTB03650.1 hypothetical protein C6V82_03965 [Halomonas urumqiensis]GHE20139.1 hypothetical protein GCM10017767_06600 [Halomonas urumqiensis]